MCVGCSVKSGFTCQGEYLPPLIIVKSVTGVLQATHSEEDFRAKSERFRQAEQGIGRYQTFAAFDFADPLATGFQFPRQVGLTEASARSARPYRVAQP